MFTPGEVMEFGAAGYRAATEIALGKLMTEEGRINLAKLEPVQIDGIIYSLRQYRASLNCQE